jgi:hypothetical protein
VHYTKPRGKRHIHVADLLNWSFPVSRSNPRTFSSRFGLLPPAGNLESQAGGTTETIIQHPQSLELQPTPQDSTWRPPSCCQLDGQFRPHGTQTISVHYWISKSIAGGTVGTVLCPSALREHHRHIYQALIAPTSITLFRMTCRKALTPVRLSTSGCLSI